MNSRFKRTNQKATSQDFTKEVLKKISQKPNIAHFCFTRKVFPNFSKLTEYLLFGNRLSVVKIDFKSF